MATSRQDGNPLNPGQREQTPPAFYENLSRIWFTPRLLRELDRRLPKTSYPVPPDRSALRQQDVADLRRFAMRGGPQMDDLRGVSPRRGTNNIVDDE